MALSDLIKKHIKSKPEYTYLGKTKIYCSACSKTFNVSNTAVKCHINSHEKSERHRLQRPKWSKQGGLRQQSLESIDADRSANPWFQGVTKFFAQTNIPFFRLNFNSCREFFVKFCNLEPPDESTLRKYYLKNVYEDTLAFVRDEIGNGDIYLQIDESTMHDRRIVSVLVGKLDGQAPTSRLFYQHELDEPPNKVNIAQIILDSLRVLWNGNFYYNRFRLLLSDQAAYMLAAGETIKATFPLLLHVTCLCHALNRVCSLVNDSYPKIELLVNKFKKVFKRSLVRKTMLERRIKAKLPSPPCKTRWGTWIHFCCFLLQHLDSIRMVVSLIEDETIPGYEMLLELLNRNEIRDQLVAIEQLEIILPAIKELETSGLTVLRQKEIIDNLLMRLPEKYKEKLLDSLGKNPDYYHIGDEMSNDDCKYLHLCPIN